MVTDAERRHSLTVDDASEFYEKYVTGEVLGTGNGSIVRKCRFKSGVSKEYAVKILELSDPSHREVEDLLQSTTKEVACMRLCHDHPNICRIEESFFTNSFIFLVLELCDGGELFEYLNSVVTISERQSRYFMRQILSALDFIHERRIVHRDLKPENLLLKRCPYTSSLVVKVSDFGFSHQLTSPSERLKDTCGTPSYMAPEMLTASMDDNSSGYGMEIDLWAAGVTLFFMLSGGLPFWHRRQLIMVRYIREGRFSFSAPEWVDVSEMAKDLIRKLLTIDPLERLTAAQALRHPYLVNGYARDVRKRRFVGAIYAIRFIHRLQGLSRRNRSASDSSVPSVPSPDAADSPHQQRTLRQQIDAAAFKVYGHWVKREEQQTRMTLIQNDDSSADSGIGLPTV